MTEQVEVGLRCRVFNANGFEALNAAQKKAQAGDNCPLLGTTVELQITNKPNTPEAGQEVVAALTKCEVCSLRPQVWDIL